MPRYKLTLEYAGTRYSGWQKQVNARTVQGELERAVRAATGAPPLECQGSGRTDAGVHALGQVAHLDVRSPGPPEKLRRAINDALPADIHVLALQAVPPRFHARHAAKARFYLYQVATRRTAFAKPFVWWVKEPLDSARVTRAAQAFAGFHDFRSFTDDSPEQKSTQVLVESVDVVEDGHLLLVRVGGSHFLWKMVRRMVGVLVAIGRGDLPEESAAKLLREPSDLPARLTAPASGLFLERVLYDGDPREHPLRAALPVL